MEQQYLKTFETFSKEYDISEGIFTNIYDKIKSKVVSFKEKSKEKGLKFNIEWLERKIRDLNKLDKRGSKKLSMNILATSKESIKDKTVLAELEKIWACTVLNNKKMCA